MGKSFKYALILSLLGFVMAFILAITNIYTSPLIEKQELNKVLTFLNEVDENLNWEINKNKFDNIEASYIGENDERKVYAFKTKTIGYASGEIILLSFIENNKIINLKIITMTNQTSGIGTKINDQKYLESFNGRSVNMYINKQINDFDKFSSDIISGATISSKALLKGLIYACNAYYEINKNDFNDEIIYIDYLNKVNNSLKWENHDYSDEIIEHTYVGKNNNDIEIYAFKSKLRYLLYGDYYATLEMIVFIKNEEIHKILMVYNSQTSEYGIKINDQNYLDSFIKRSIYDFEGKNINDYTNENVDIISGSTVSSKAVINIIINSCNGYLKGFK